MDFNVVGIKTFTVIPNLTKESDKLAASPSLMELKIFKPMIQLIVIFVSVLGHIKNNRSFC